VIDTVTGGVQVEPIDTLPHAFSHHSLDESERPVAQWPRGSSSPRRCPLMYTLGGGRQRVIRNGGRGRKRRIKIDRAMGKGGKRDKGVKIE
jgi:hypothetical protein